MAMVKMLPDIFSFFNDQGNLEIEIRLPGAKREETGVEYVELRHPAAGYP